MIWDIALAIISVLVGVPLLFLAGMLALAVIAAVFAVTFMFVVTWMERKGAL